MFPPIGAVHKYFAFNCSLESCLEQPGHYDIMCLCHTGQLIPTSVNSTAIMGDIANSTKEENTLLQSGCVAHMSDTCECLLSAKIHQVVYAVQANKRKGIIQFKYTQKEIVG